MKLTRLHIIRWKTFCLLFFLVLGSTLTLANFRSDADSEMPDISGMWTYSPTSPAPDDVNRDLIAPPQSFVMRRSTQAGVDFEYLGTSEPTANPRQLIWEPGTRRFRAVTAAGTTWQPREMFELSTDGNQLSVRTMTTADEAKRLAAKGRVSDKVFTERYLTEQWRRAEAPKVADDSKEALFDVVGSQPEKNDIATEPSSPPTKTGVPQSINDSNMPDITGTWRVKHTEPVDSNNTFFTWEIRRVQQGEIDFLIDMPWVNETPRLPVKWSAVRQRFEGEFKDGDSDTENYAFTLQSQADGNSLLVIFNPTNESKKYVTQIWTRVSKTLATTYSPKDFQRTEEPPSESRTGNLMKGADRVTGSTTMNDEALQPSVLPNTPAAKDLLKRLSAQESAAASAANEIRRLQANGSAVETIEPHQAQLKGHLQTAFELKMQLEELQVQGLQSRLSRLERQIGQRKALREKIIARRAAELLNPDVSWEATAQKSSAAVSSVAGATDQQQSGLTVALPLIVGRYSEELLQSQVGFSGISLYAENVQATTNDGKPVRATVVLAHDCRLDSFEPIQGSNGQLWDAKFHVLQGEQADGSHQELTQEKVTHLAEAGAIFVLDQMRSGDDNQMRSDADNPVEMSAAVPKVLQIRLRCDRQMSINKGLVGAGVVFADNGQIAIMSVSPGRQMEFSFVEGVENSRGPFLLSFQYNGTDTTATTWLANNVLPIEFLAGDQDRATSGQLIEKAVYIDSASGAVTTISSHTIEPGVDPVNVAATKGIVIGVVRISKGTVRSVGVDETRNADSTPKNAKPPNTNSKEPRTTSSAGSDPNTDLPGHTIEPAFPKNTFVNDESVPGIESLAAAADSASLQDTEMGSFQGTWCFDVLQSDAWPKPIGEPTDSSGRKSQQRWIIKGDLITWTSLDNEQIEVSFTIDPTKTPKQIDFTFLSGPQKGMKSIGIYEPQKGNADYVWLCMTNPGTDAPRPTKVDYSTEKQQSMIGIYPVAQSEIPEVAVYLQRFQGDWQMTLCDSTLEGFGSSQDEVKKWTWTIRGDEILWSRNGEAWQLKIDADPAKTPGELDLTYLTGPHKGSKCLGMYQWGGVDQSQLMIAIQDPGSDAPRPTKFSMSSDLKTGLMILEPRRADLK